MLYFSTFLPVLERKIENILVFVQHNKFSFVLKLTSGEIYFTVRYHVVNSAHNTTGLPTKDETSETTVRNLYCQFTYIYYSSFPVTSNHEISHKMTIVKADD